MRTRTLLVVALGLIAGACGQNAKPDPKDRTDEKDRAGQSVGGPSNASAPTTKDQGGGSRVPAGASAKDDPLASFSTMSDGYKVDPYIRAAAALQKMGKDEACRRLRALTGKKGDGVPVANLCRLVFKAKKGSTFRRAAIGAVGFLGETSYEDWPLDPFEVVDGVPFVVTDGSYFLAGVPEFDKEYLDYCMKECDWNDVKFAPKSAAEKEKALKKLLSSKKWKKPLTAEERDRLRAQIK
jgi:hypothetical protein